jgi:hypothetical protein
MANDFLVAVIAYHKTLSIFLRKIPAIRPEDCGIAIAWEMDFLRSSSKTSLLPRLGRFTMERVDGI